MIQRPYWHGRVEEAWKKAPIAWLSGVRRAGKTVLAQGFTEAAYFNCDLPSVRQQLADPEVFFTSLKATHLVLDEVHQLPDPSKLLKIAADAFPKLKLLATGSSTLAATHKFSDTLTGRKREVRLTPILFTELPAFGIPDIRVRLRRGGLPPALLSEEFDAGFYDEWLDSYYARDVQELFAVEKRREFLLLVELVLRQSGGLFEISRLARDAGLARSTVMNYLEVLELTHVAHVLRPWSGGSRGELLRQPKVFGFDTGFVCHTQGWTELRNTDLGLLWEHLVLDELQTQLPARKIHFWRDRYEREIDFVLPAGRDHCDAIECTWNPENFDPENLRVFRQIYPKGHNLVISPSVQTPYRRRFGELEVQFASPANWQLE
jgi:predicted AAA+ superfamily ATPase